MFFFVCLCNLVKHIKSTVVLYIPDIVVISLYILCSFPTQKCVSDHSEMILQVQMKNQHQHDPPGGQRGISDIDFN